MSEIHVSAPAPAAAVNVTRKSDTPSDESPRLFKRRIDCEETRERVVPAREQRTVRGGRRRSDKPVV